MKKILFTVVVLVLVVAFGVSAFMVGNYLIDGKKQANRYDELSDIAANAQITHFNASNPGSLTAPIIDNDSRITRFASTLSLKNSYERTSGAINLFFNKGRHRMV